jgi:hypothetical protein
LPKLPYFYTKQFNLLVMKKIITLLFLFPLWRLGGLYAQKELWGVNTGDEYTNPASYFGNITKYDINGENPAIMHEFDSINGYRPKGKLFLASNGKLYGTTIAGGNVGPTGSNSTAGVLFEYNLILEQYRVLHYFEFDNNGRSPFIGLTEPTLGQLYGASSNRMYKYDMVTELVTFYNNLPYTNSIRSEFMKASDGNLYGTSFDNLCPNQFSTGYQNGCVIKFNMATNTLSVVHDLNCDINSEGASPWTPLVETSPGKLLGATLTGGYTPLGGEGILFEYNFYTNTYTKKIDLNNTIGRTPNTLINGGNGKIYGLCEYGGVPPGNTSTNPTDFRGTLFEYTPATNAIEVKQYFGTTPGNSVRFPTSLMRTSNGYFMGTVPNGGLFKYDAITNIITEPNYDTQPIVLNGYNVSNLLEICRKPSYQEIIVNTFDGCVGGTFNYNVQNTNATTYQWQLNNVNVTGQTTEILNLTNLQTTDAGAYTCVMTNECGTTATMPLNLTVNCLGINTIASLKKAIKLYPNPANSYLNIELPKNIEVNITSLKVSDMLGKEVLHIDEIHPSVGMTKIDVSALAKGVYILSLKTNYGNWNGKFMKE